MYWLRYVTPGFGGIRSFIDKKKNSRGHTLKKFLPICRLESMIFNWACVITIFLSFLFNDSMVSLRAY